MNKRERNRLITFLSNILKKSDISNYKLFELTDTKDNDINFIIVPNIKSIKNEDEYKFTFLLYCSDASTLTIYCPTVYKLSTNDSAMFTLNAINNVNSNLTIGKIYLNKINSSVISYINTILFNDITKELTVDLLDDYINSFLMTVIDFYEQMDREK